MRRLVHLVALVSVVAALGGCAAMHAKGRGPQGALASGFVNKTMTVDGEERRYAVYVPREYAPDRAWPLVVFLHGLGERGDDGLIQTEVGIGRAIRRHSDRFPCIVLMPQCPGDRWWNKAYAHIDAALAQTREEYSIDPDRITLTGLSMGGFGTWAYGAARVGTFAALAPICGGGRPADATELAKVPIRVFHGADDETVPPKKSLEMVEAVKEAGGDIVYTEYPGIGHNSWDEAYGSPATIRWLLKQAKN